MKGHDRDTSSGKPSATNRNCRAFPSLAKNSENFVGPPTLWISSPRTEIDRKRAFAVLREP
jgi:hypothetical protein